jgi:cytochrome bd-type quinol oxidase subunit 2
MSPTSTTARKTPRNPALLAAAYAVLAVVGLVGTWWFNLTYRGGNYLGDWFANPASSSAAVDILVVFAVCVIFYARESRRLGWRAWVPVVFAATSLTIAVAFAFPLFLALRELTIARAGPSRKGQGGRPRSR